MHFAVISLVLGSAMTISGIRGLMGKRDIDGSPSQPSMSVILVLIGPSLVVAGVAWCIVQFHKL